MTQPTTIHIELDVELSGRYAWYFRAHPHEAKASIVDLFTADADSGIRPHNIRITQRPDTDAPTGPFGISYIADSAIHPNAKPSQQ